MTMADYRTLTVPGYEQVVRCDDPDSGLEAVIAIHDTSLGPALGGCRMWRYASERAAVDDALRLARGMTCKAAVAGLPLGGGKAVILGDAREAKSPALFHAFGRMVESLHGRYITGEDVGTSVEDMAIVAEETEHVAGIAEGSGDPSPVTAAGVFHGIRAAVRHRLGREDLAGLKVAVQGVGHVGYHLCRLLHGAGAELAVTDVAAGAVARAAVEFGAAAVSPDAIYDVDADLFAPCALGGTVNRDTVPRLKAAIVAGSANNQLAEARHGEALRRRDILYAPDYVINAGGVIAVSHEGPKFDKATVTREVARIHDTLREIFRRAAAEGIPTSAAADRLAEERLREPPAAVAAA
jgi:leucine dehydrogenase